MSLAPEQQLACPWPPSEGAVGCSLGCRSALLSLVCLESETSAGIPKERILWLVLFKAKRLQSKIVTKDTFRTAVIWASSVDAGEVMASLDPGGVLHSLGGAVLQVHSELLSLPGHSELSSGIGA